MTLNYYKYRERIFPNVAMYEPLNVRNKTREEWMAETLDSCVKNRDPQCFIKHGEIVDHQVEII